MKIKMTARYRHGWTDPRGMFGDAPIRREGEAVSYDNDLNLDINKHEIEVELDTGEIINDDDAE